MILQTYQLEVITPCFCGGADPTQHAEIRPASIRGQLRWWFRVLGGFKSLPHQSVEEQEAMIFGSASGDEGQAGMLTVRVKSGAFPATQLYSTQANPLERYLAFPLFHQARSGIRAGHIFELQFLWRGDARFKEDLAALAIVFGNLGSLGFRSRRAMGALMLHHPNGSLTQALARFNRSADAVRVFEINGNFQAQNQIPPEARVVSGLANWLKSWRTHGQMNRRWQGPNGPWIQISEQQRQENRNQPGFRYARRDHNEGLSVQGTPPPNPDPEQPKGQAGETFRPALGLPIIQYFSSLGNHRPIPRQAATVNWEYNQDGGRFASPVILRPHKDAQGRWHALVIFVDAKQWPNGKSVFLKRPHGHETRTVSLDLYNAMKADPRLMAFI